MCHTRTYRCRLFPREVRYRTSRCRDTSGVPLLQLRSWYRELATRKSEGGGGESSSSCRPFLSLRIEIRRGLSHARTRWLPWNYPFLVVRNQTTLPQRRNDPHLWQHDGSLSDASFVQEQRRCHRNCSPLFFALVSVSPLFSESWSAHNFLFEQSTDSDDAEKL